MEKRAMCFVCRISFNTSQPNGVFFGNEISRFRKQECAETISNLLLGSTSHPLNIYFQSAAYCIRCTKIILDVNFTWKQLTALENRINHNLKVLRILFKKNFEGIPDKVDIDVPDVDPENLQEWESFTYDQVIQICMKVMHVEDADSVLNPDQIHFVDPYDYLKTHFEEVNDEEDYFYLNSFEGEVKENELVGNLVGSSDRIKVYAKEDDTDSSFEVSSDTSDSSSYCSSNSGGRRKRKFRKKPILQNNPNVNVETGLPITNAPLQGNNNGLTDPAKVGLPNSQIVGAVGIGTSSASPIQKPTAPLPIPIASINQVVSSEFLKKFPIPIDKNKIVTESKPVILSGTNNTPPILSKPGASVFSQLPPSTISSIKPVAVNRDKETPTPPTTIIKTNQPKPPQISVKSVSNATVIPPVINFKPTKVVTKDEAESPATKPTATAETVESVNPRDEVKLSVGSIINVIPNTSRHTSINNRTKQPHMKMPVNYQRNNSRFPMSSRPGPSSRTKGPLRNTATKRNHKIVGRSPKTKNNAKKRTGRGHDSDSSSKSVLSCSSFSSDSISSDFDSSSDDNTLYPSASLAKLQTHKKSSGNCSSSSSIVVLSD